MKLKLNAAIAAATALLMTACRTVPDVQPFAKATAQLAGGIKSSGRLMASEVDFISKNWPQPKRDQAMKTAENFNKQWTERNALADALLEYSASITSIAQAGEQGEQSANEVAASFKKLTDTIGVALPGGAAAGEAVAVAAGLYGKFAQDRAARTLGESMQRLQPAVDTTAKVLADSLVKIETGLDVVLDQASPNIDDEVLVSGATTKVRVERNLLKVSIDERHKLLSKTNLSDGDIAKLRHLDDVIKSSTATLAPFDARIASDRERLLSEIELVRAIRGGLSDWAAAHARVAAAALERKPLQIDDLVQTALEIQELIKKTRSQKKE